MTRRWRRDQIQEDYTEQQWNDMYKKAEEDEEDSEIEDWNELYITKDHKNDPDVVEWNEQNK